MVEVSQRGKKKVCSCRCYQMRKWGGTSREPALWTFGRPYKTPGEEPLVRAIFLWPWNENAPTKQKQQTEIQNVPIVRSSNFMHYNFWSKLYFYLKFLEGVVHFSINCTCIQNFSDWHALFLSHSVAVAEWSGIQRLDPFWSLLSPGFSCSNVG